MATQHRSSPTPEEVVLAIVALGEDATVERVTQLQAYMALPVTDQPAPGVTLPALTGSLEHARLLIEGRLGDAKVRLREASARAQSGTATEHHVLDAIRLHTQVNMCNWALEMLPNLAEAPLLRGAGAPSLTVESLAAEIHFARKLFVAHIGTVVSSIATGDLSLAQVPRVGDEALAELGSTIDALGQVLDTIPDPTGTIARPGMSATDAAPVNPSEKTTVFSFRAECATDVERFEAECAQDGIHVVLRQEPMQLGADVKVEMTTPANLEALRAAVRRVPDGHVMLQTMRACALVDNSLERETVDEVVAATSTGFPDSVVESAQGLTGAQTPDVRVMADAYIAATKTVRLEGRTLDAVFTEPVLAVVDRYPADVNQLGRWDVNDETAIALAIRSVVDAARNGKALFPAALEFDSRFNVAWHVALRNSTEIQPDRGDPLRRAIAESRMREGTAPAPGTTEMPVGTSARGGGTNHPGKPEREGQLAVFQSPYARDVLLVDIAETDRYGGLRWVALSDQDPRYQQAIANALEQKTAGVASDAVGQGSQRETDDGFPYLELRKAGVVLLHARAGHQEFLVPEGVNESKWLEQTAVHDRREAENLIERARQLTERAGYAEMAAALCKPATPQTEQTASGVSLDM